MVPSITNVGSLSQAELRYIEGWNISDSIDIGLGESASQDLWPFLDLETVQDGRSQRDKLPFGLGTPESLALGSGFMETQTSEIPDSITSCIDMAPRSAIGSSSP